MTYHIWIELSRLVDIDSYKVELCNKHPEN